MTGKLWDLLEYISKTLAGHVHTMYIYVWPLVHLVTSSVFGLLTSSLTSSLSKFRGLRWHCQDLFLILDFFMFLYIRMFILCKLWNRSTVFFPEAWYTPNIIKKLHVKLLFLIIKSDLHQDSFVSTIFCMSHLWYTFPSRI